MDINNLPREIQNEIRETLKCYDEVNVIFENGEYKVRMGYMLQREYSSDFKIIGEFKANEVFSDNERIVNYIESFMGYPIEYKGVKDWDLIKKLGDLRNEGKNINIILDENGNAKLKGDNNVE